MYSFYPALTGSKTPSQGSERNEKDRWGINCRMCPIGSDGQDVGHSDVVKGRGAFNVSSSSKTTLIEFHFI